MSISIAILSRDLLFIIIPAGLIFLSSFYSGCDKTILAFMACFISFVFTNLFRFDAIGNLSNINIVKVAVFILLILACYLALSGRTFKSMTKKSGKGKLLKRVIYALTLAGLIMSNVAFFVRFEAIENIPMLKTALASQTSRFLWFIFAVVLIVLVKKKKEG